MRSIVYVDSDEIEPAHFNRKISSNQPITVHVSKTVIATNALPSVKLESTWVNVPVNCPDRLNSSFTYTKNDIKKVLVSTKNTEKLNNTSYSILLELFRSTLDLFCLEVERFVGPFVKCARKDVDMALTV
jgi:hypothetical protein